jgi:spermidine synthase
MSSPAPAIPPAAPRLSFLPSPPSVLLCLLFFLSGASGLVYETVWLRILSRVVGNTVYATSVVLASFMAGMALGSLLLGRVAGRVKDQLRLYAVLEVGVAVTAVALTFLLLHLAPFYQSVYPVLQGSRAALTAFQSVLAFALLLVPTSLMGGTLPVLSAYTRTFSLSLAPRIGLLYGLNTLGAVVGVLGSGFVTIGALGETATFLAGAGLTLLVAALAFALSRRPWRDASSPAARDPAAPRISPYPPAVRRLVGVAYAVSGFAALAYEIVWTRMFQIQLGTSIYAFSMMLAVYLAGIGLGSLVGGPLLARVRRPLLALAVAQAFIAAYSVYGLFICTRYGPVTLNLSLTQYNAQMPVRVVLPITLVLGAMFPLVSRCYVASEDLVGRTIGRLYSLNTFGCIAGSLICGFVFFRLLGTRDTVLLLAGLNLAVGLAFAVAEARPARPAAVGVVLLAAAGTAALAARSPDPFAFAVSRSLSSINISPADTRVYYNRESPTATVTAIGVDGKPETLRLLVNGIGMTNLGIETKLIGHLPLMLHPDPRRVLVICFGMGTTVRSVRVHPEVTCDVVELVPDVFDTFQYFHSDAAQVLADPRIRHFADDGRNFLLVHPDTYDVINIDPAPPIWSAGTVNLYTQEFFALCKDRLTDDGILCLWIPSVQASEVKLVMKTFQTVFPNAQVWRAPRTPASGFYMMGFRNPGGPTRPIGAGFYPQSDAAAILADLNEFTWEDRIPSLDSLQSLFWMGPDALTKYVENVPPITDDHPYTEFPYWRSRRDRDFRRHIQVPQASTSAAAASAPAASQPSEK